jgi:hypothetical protein
MSHVSPASLRSHVSGQRAGSRFASGGSSARRENGHYSTRDIQHATGLTGKAAFQAAVSTGETPVVPVSAAKMATFPVGAAKMAAFPMKRQECRFPEGRVAFLRDRAARSARRIAIISSFQKMH